MARGAIRPIAVIATGVFGVVRLTAPTRTLQGDRATAAATTAGRRGVGFLWGYIFLRRPFRGALFGRWPIERELCAERLPPLRDTKRKRLAENVAKGLVAHQDAGGFDLVDAHLL